MDRWLWSVLCLLGSTPSLLSADASPLPPTPKDLERHLVVSGQGYFPVALRLRDGRIAVVLRGGAEHLGIKGRLDIVFSADEGKTWTEPRGVVDSPVDDRNPAFGQAADGSLIVGFYRTAQYDDEGRYQPRLDRPVSCWVTRSRDGGRNWDEPRAVDVSEISWGSPYGRILTLPDGTLLMAVYGGSLRKPNEARELTGIRQRSYLYRSTDHGLTWARFSGPIGGEERQFSETALLRLPDGQILAAMRSRATDVWITDSRDDGRTWSPPQPLTPAQVHPADLLLLADHRVLLTVGYRQEPFGVRAMIRDAQGRWDWKSHFLLVRDAVGGDCGYPSSVLLKDGRVLTVYYATRVREHRSWGVHCAAVIYTPPSP